MPAPDVATRHSLRVAAPAARVYAAARQADLRSTFIVRALMALRTLPALASGMRSRGRSLGGLRFTLVAESPGEEIVHGIMGRFWTPSGGIVPADPDAFRAPPPPGLAQGLWNFRVEPLGSATLLVTETRVRCGDEETRRRFLRYWRVIRPGSALIRVSLLRRIRAEAERRVP